VQVATEAKPFASLSSGLLARKGAARPAMRPQGFGQGASGLEDLGWNDMGFEPPKPADAARDSSHDAFGEDIVEHPRAHPTGLTPIDSPVHSPVHHQQAEIVERLNGIEDPEEDEVDETAEIFEPSAAEIHIARDKQPEPPKVVSVVPAVLRRASRPRAAAGSKGKAEFTLRLDPERHLKLRLACAVDGRSAQQLVTDALDQLLERMPDLNGLAAKAKNRG
jgi:predicted HicB family RNase H-like nuclease